MDVVDKYSKFSKWFYLIILGLTIPFYLLLYGATGHQFNPPTEDKVWMAIIVIAFLTLIIHLLLGEKSGFMKVLSAVTLLSTAYGGTRIFISMIQFDYGDDIGYLFRGLSYIIPLLFTFSTIILFLRLLKKTE